MFALGRSGVAGFSFVMRVSKKKEKAHLVVLADGDVADVVLLAELLAEGRGHQTTAHAVQKESKAWEREREREREREKGGRKRQAQACVTIGSEQM